MNGLFHSLRLYHIFPLFYKIRLVQEPGWFSVNQKLACKPCRMPCILPFLDSYRRTFGSAETEASEQL
jgi:hypothetical protein